jgi:hypothetical protein
MTMTIKAAILATIGALGIVTAAQAQTVSVAVYTSFFDTGTGITFSGSPSIESAVAATSSGFLYDWNSGTIPGYTPASVFGADFTGGLTVATAGTYELTLSTDDAGYLFVNNTLVISEPSAHPAYDTTALVSLNAGYNSFEIQYDNLFCCGASTQLSLGTGVTEVSATTGAVPEPATWALMLLGFGMVGYAMRTRPAVRKLLGHA